MEREHMDRASVEGLIEFVRVLQIMAQNAKNTTKVR